MAAKGVKKVDSRRRKGGSEPLSFESREALESRQMTLLRAGLEAASVTNPFLKAKLASAGVVPKKLRTVADLRSLPFTTKEELVGDQAAAPPFGSNLSFSLERYSRLHQTSGTTGRKLTWLDTPESWSWFMERWDEIFAAAELTPSDRLFFPFSFGPFLAFWAAFDAATRAGRFTIAAGGMTSVARLRLLEETGATVLLATPTYARRLLDVAAAEKIDLAASPLRRIILAGEPGASIPSVRARLESGFGARVLDHYGMTEIGPVAAEFASWPNRLYVFEDQFIAEAINPVDGSPATEGAIGELVVTNLGRWGSPLVRYRTGDLVRLLLADHPTGRPFRFLEGGVLGRSDDMFWIKGNNVHPATLEGIISAHHDVAEFALELDESGPAPRLLVRLEPTARAAGDLKLADRVSRDIQDRCYFRPEVELVPPGSLPRPELKSRRFTRHAESRGREAK